MGNDLVERLKKLAHQQADVNGDPSYDGKRMLTHEDTMYWAAAARIEALEEVLKEVACTCPGECERKTDLYAPTDMCCRAHDALKTIKPRI